MLLSEFCLSICFFLSVVLLVERKGAWGEAVLWPKGVPQSLIIVKVSAIVKRV